MSIRLNKLLANRGIASRRHCDDLIAQGLVKVNGRVVTEAGTTVEEGRDRVEVEGRPLPGRQRLVYYVLNKPVGVITTLDDPQGRRTVRELLPRGARVYPVGRLDADTSGLLLLTNDGDLAHRLMHPRYGVNKVYRVRLDREPARHQIERLARGVEFEPGVTSAPAKARRIDPGFDAIMIEIQIHEGRFRQVRRMCEAVGLNVTGLHRVGYGPIRLGPLARGMFRELSEDEVARLRAESARPGGTKPWRTPGPKRRARPEELAPKAAKPMPPEVEEEDADAEIGETWIPGGGFASERDDDDEGDADTTPAWPARPDSRRGDADFAGPSAPRSRERAEAPRSPRRESPGRSAARPQRARGEDARRSDTRGPRAGAGRDRFAPRPAREARPFREREAPRGPRAGAGRDRFAPRPDREARPFREREAPRGPRAGAGRDRFAPRPDREARPFREREAPRGPRGPRAERGATPLRGRRDERGPQRSGEFGPRRDAGGFRRARGEESASGRGPRRFERGGEDSRTRRSTGRGAPPARARDARGRRDERPARAEGRGPSRGLSPARGRKAGSSDRRGASGGPRRSGRAGGSGASRAPRGRRSR